MNLPEHGGRTQREDGERDERPFEPVCAPAQPRGPRGFADEEGDDVTSLPETLTPKMAPCVTFPPAWIVIGNHSCPV